MKIMIITDAWKPQINGVVTTITAVINYIKQQGHIVEVVEPSQFFTLPLPSYSEIRIAINTYKVKSKIKAFAPDKIHIVTEGPLGFAALRFLRKHKYHYTTSFHTKFPEYIHERLPFISIKTGYKLTRYFHKDSQHVFAATENVRKELEDNGLKNGLTWSRGVDTETFRPLSSDETNPLAHIKEKIYLCVSRVSPEKNLETFLNMNVPGKKVMVGDGPIRKKLEKEYPDTLFVGYKTGRELGRHYAAADVFVFPSLTDTFGVVMLEAMASGLPVAAFNVTGPNNVVTPNKTGVLSDDISVNGLEESTAAAELLNRQDCIDFAKNNSWNKTAEFFLDHLVDMKTAVQYAPNKHQQKTYT